MNQPDLLPIQPHQYPPTFEQCWRVYPKRAGANPKKAAFRAYQTATRRGHDPADILTGVERYAAYCEAVGSLHTQYVLRASTFFGPDEYWLEDWEIPKDTRKPEWAKIPREDDKLWDWAKEHGYPGPGSMTYQGYRRFLEGKIEGRLKESPRREPGA